MEEQFQVQPPPHRNLRNRRGLVNLELFNSFETGLPSALAGCPAPFGPPEISLVFCSLRACTQIGEEPKIGNVTYSPIPNSFAGFRRAMVSSSASVIPTLLRAARYIFQPSKNGGKFVPPKSPAITTCSAPTA